MHTFLAIQIISYTLFKLKVVSLGQQIGKRVGMLETHQVTIIDDQWKWSYKEGG